MKKKIEQLIEGYQNLLIKTEVEIKTYYPQTECRYVECDRLEARKGCYKLFIESLQKLIN